MIQIVFIFQNKKLLIGIFLLHDLLTLYTLSVFKIDFKIKFNLQKNTK